MADQTEFSVRDFFTLGNDGAANSAELKIRLAQAGVIDRAVDRADADGDGSPLSRG